MNRLKSLATDHPLLFMLSSIIAWLFLLTAFTGICSSLLGRPFGDPATVTIGRLSVVACVLFLLLRLGWLRVSGVACVGGWRVWLVALGGLVYFAGATLYAFYGSLTFDFAILRHSSAFAVVATSLIGGLSEELMFRGLVLYVLLRAWFHSRRGLIGSVVLAAALFSILHLMQAFAGISLPSMIFLILETCFIAIWWGALVVRGRSIWPGAMHHSIINTVAALQGLSTAMVETGVLAYRRIFWFSIPLAAIGIWLLARASYRPNPQLPEESAQRDAPR